MKLILCALLLGPGAGAASAAADCPLNGETALDCPWAAIGRSASGAKDPLADVRAGAPGVIAQLESDAKDPEMLALWGKSVNFDEHANGIIVPPVLLSALFATAKTAAGHAGVTHTYGYLFSPLKTPFGFKRARWVDGAIEKGFKLPEGTLSPAPKQGTLLSNLTAFIGRIAFRDDPREFAIVEKMRPFDVSGLKPRRLTEKYGRAELRTDIVPYPAGGGNLLVYSWRDPQEGRAYLITAFPTGDKFADSLFAPKSADAPKPAPHYNADVPLLPVAAK